MKEHDIQKRIVSCLRRLGCITICTDMYLPLMFFGKNQKARLSYISYAKGQGADSGVSDLVAITKKEAIFIEVKKWGIGKTGKVIGRTKQSPEQINFQKTVEERGFKYFLINDPEVETELYNYINKIATE